MIIQTLLQHYLIDDDCEGILPFDVCPGLLVWDHDGNSLYGMATFTQPRRLGLIYCSNRKSCIFKLCLGSKRYFELSSQGGKGDNISCRSPRLIAFNEKSKYLIWLERDLDQPKYPGPHQSCFRLMKMNMVGKNKPEIVIDIKNDYDPKVDNFAGLYNCKIGKNCMLSENEIILTTVVNDTFIPVACNLETGAFWVLEDGGRHVMVHDSVYDPVSHTALVVGSRSSPLQAPHIVLGILTPESEPSGIRKSWKISCSTIGDIAKLDGLPQNATEYVWKTMIHKPNHVINGRYIGMFDLE